MTGRFGSGRDWDNREVRSRRSIIIYKVRRTVHTAARRWQASVHFTRQRQILSSWFTASKLNVSVRVVLCQHFHFDSSKSIHNAKARIHSEQFVAYFVQFLILTLVPAGTGTGTGDPYKSQRHAAAVYRYQPWMLSDLDMRLGKKTLWFAQTALQSVYAVWYTNYICQELVAAAPDHSATWIADKFSLSETVKQSGYWTLVLTMLRLKKNSQNVQKILKICSEVILRCILRDITANRFFRLLSKMPCAPPADCDVLLAGFVAFRKGNSGEDFCRTTSPWSGFDFG